MAWCVDTFPFEDSPYPLTFRFDTEEEARAFANRLEGMDDRRRMFLSAGHGGFEIYTPVEKSSTVEEALASLGEYFDWMDEEEEDESKEHPDVAERPENPR